MALCDDCFDDFLHPLVHELMDKNNRHFECYGHHARWDWEEETKAIRFSDSTLPTLRIKVTLVGTTEGESWEWSWANPNIDEREKRGIEKVREYGEANGFEKLTSKFLEANEYTGWAMTAVAAHLLNSPGAYRIPSESGHFYYIFKEIEIIPQDRGEISGAMKGAMVVAPGVDLTEPIDAVWKVMQDDYKGCC